MKRRIGSVGLSIIMMFSLFSGYAGAEQATSSCYAHINYGKAFDTRPKRVLYIIVDQTLSFPAPMKERVKQLVAGWGKSGDSVKIARFSANFRGKYPSLTFSESVEAWPGQQYAYGLRVSDRKTLESCLQKQQQTFSELLSAKLTETLNGMNPSSPKTDIFSSLKQIAAQVAADPTREKIVLLISDGLENSDVTSFYRRGNIRAIKSSKEIAKIRRKGLIANWQGAKVYMYGMGLAPKPGQYVKSSTVKGLGRFWDRYFTEGNARIVALGSPELLISQIE